MSHVRKINAPTPPVSLVRAKAAVMLLLALVIAASSSFGAERVAPSSSVEQIGPIRTLFEFQRAGALPERPMDIRIDCNVVATKPGLITVRDASSTITLNVEGAPAQAGDRIRLEGDGGSPMERISDFPSETDVLSSLEETKHAAAPFSARVRALLSPPASGVYEFWIASDDESELLLSTGPEPENARAIAQVNAWTGATGPREWEKVPDQHSLPVTLEAGRSYYIEVLHRNVIGNAHWSVAWKGPGFERAVIGGAHLAEWNPKVKGPHGFKPVVRERWMGYCIPLLGQFRTVGPIPTRPAKIRNLRLTVLGKAQWEEARKIHPGDLISNEETLPYVEAEGVVTRAANSIGQSTLELAWKGHTMNVVVRNPGYRNLKGLLDRFIRVRGICEGIVDGRERRIAGVLHVLSLDEITLCPPPFPEAAPERPIHHPAELGAPASAVWTQPSVRSLGTLRSLPDGSLLLEGESISEVTGYFSHDGKEWRELGRTRMPLAKELHVGLAVTSYNPATTTEASFQELNGFAGTLRGEDLGQPAVQGSSTQSGNQWTIRAGGKDIWNDSQEGYFLHTRMNGDFEVSVRCDSLKNTGQWAKAGLMVRENLSEQSRYVLLAAVPQKLAMFQFREADHGFSSPVITTPASLPGWFKIRVRNIASAVAIQPVSQTAAFGPGTRVEACGVLESDAGHVRLADAFLRPLLPSEKTATAMESARTIGTVREAQQTIGSGERYLIWLRGVVTSARSIQDETGALYIDEMIANTRGAQSVQPGDFVELAGTTRESRSSVTIQPILTRILGKGAMPEPKRFPWAHLVTGAADAQWIEQSGVVRSCGTDSFELLVAGGTIEVTNPWTKWSGGRVREFVGTAVTVRGICWMQFDEEGRPARVRIVPPSLEYVSIERSSLANPFDAPPIEIGEMIRMAAVGPLRYRTVRGVVTFAEERTVYLQNKTGAVRVDTVSPSGLKPGDAAEAAGYPFLPGQPMPYLAFAQARKTGGGVLPKPVTLIPSDLERLVPKGELVSLDASLLEMHTSGNRMTLALSAGSKILHATTAGTSALPRNSSLPEGTLVRIQGVCIANGEALHILLRDRRDVQVVQWPARWKRERMLMALAAVVLVAAIVFLVGLLRSRRRLREQIEYRRQSEAEFEAIEGERTRLATELHDTLEQSLTGVAFRLLAALKSFEPNRERSRQHLEEARTLLNDSQLEVRRSVWNLRSRILEDADLPEALSTIGNQLTSAANVRLSLKTEGKRMRLPEFLESHLLRIGQEAITNAVKHAGANEIDVTLRYASDSISLIVTDDGQGMDLNSRLGKDGKGHFGLLGMKERTVKIDGKLSFESCSGRTRIIVQAPAMERSTSS